MSALGRPICDGLQKRLRDLALEAALDTALDRPNHGSRWAAEWVAFSHYRKVGLPRPLAKNG